VPPRESAEHIVDKLGALVTAFGLQPAGMDLRPRVRLTAAGEKLAALVLRRHRLVELFLVQVMGMSWAEVHDEAEQLEHVVSERLIERIDEMLGHPTHDPHGDPIPNPDGAIASRELDTLLTCPVGMPLRVTRVADQDPAFRRFVENNQLKPGQPVEVETRDAAADSVRLRREDHKTVTIGTRAASKLLVEADAGVGPRSLLRARS
jgi:DtxR family Mn-dependent transcriptional regulator